MITNNYWNTPSALGWLQIIVRERFGHALTLQPQPDGTCISIYAAGDSRCITLPLDGSTFTNSNSDMPCAHWNAGAESCQTVLSGALPAPGIAQLPTPLITPTDNGWHIGYDILGLTYWMLTRLEEVSRTDLDSHGRFPATSSHAFKYGYLERPIVDEWLHILGQVIQRTWPGVVLKQHNFKMKVSHDVDRPSRYGFRNLYSLARAVVGDALRRQAIKSAAVAPWIRMNTRKTLHPLDPANTFDWIMDVSEQHGLTSAFYFICGRTVPTFDADYEPDHPAIRGLMRRIHERGHEIGLHPSYGTYQQPDLLKAEAERLRRIADEEGIEQSEWGGRMHYLRWEQPTTLQAWANAGMTYDSTLGYADRPGFRCGTCFEYPAFDPVAGEALSVRVRPLVAMECSVMSSGYMSLGVTDAARDKFLELKNTCRAVQGCFTLLWHNTELETKNKRRLYRTVIIS